MRVPEEGGGARQKYGRKRGVVLEEDENALALLIWVCFLSVSKRLFV